MDVFNIQAKLGLDVKEYLSSLGKASDESSKFGLGIKGTFSSAMKVGAAAIGAVVTETTALSAALVKGVGDLAEYGDHIDKQSQKMNMSAQAYQEWDAIMQHSGTSIDSMQMSMKTLANAAESGSDAFGLLGMSLEDVQRMSSEELFKATITALQNVESDTQRTYIAGQLLGRGATELGALLNTSAEDTEKMRQRVHELGGVMSDEAVKAAAAYQDSLQDMKTSMSGLTRGITGEFLPSFTEVMDGLTSIFAGEDGGAEKVSKGIDDILGNISSAVTKLKPVVSKIGGVIASAVKENAPKLIKEGTKLLGDIVVGVVQNLPDILSTVGDVIGTIGGTLADTASTLVTDFSGYIRNNLPTLIPEGVNAVVEFAKGITDPSNTGTLIDAAFDIIDGLIEGFTSEDTINAIVEGAPVILDNLVDGIVKATDKLADAALTLTGNLLSYLSNPENRQKLYECADRILDSIAQGFIALVGTGAEAVYNFGGQIAENIGLGDYWKVGNEALGKWWDGFSAKWGEFKGWFDLEISDLLNPLKFAQKINESIAKISDLIGIGHDIESTGGRKRATAEPEQFNYDELETLSVLPEEYRAKHGNLSDRKRKHASGGIFTKPYYASGDWFGENGREALLPLDNNTAWMDKLVNKINGGPGYTFNFYYQGGNGMSDAEIEEQARRLADLSIAQIRAIGGTGF
jgi:hypothetical protein